MSEPLNTPPGQWFGVLFLSLALLWPRAPLSFVLISYVVYPTVAVAEQIGGWERLFGESGESLIRLSGSSNGIRAESPGWLNSCRLLHWCLLCGQVKLLSEDLEGRGPHGARGYQLPWLKFVALLGRIGGP